MKIQRKLLTKKQKERICKNMQDDYDIPCLNCPLYVYVTIKGIKTQFCYTAIDKLRKQIDKIDCEEVEVKL